MHFIHSLLLSAVAAIPLASDFITVKGIQFVKHGEEFYFSGANTYYLFYAKPNDVDALFADAKSIGLQVIRTWAWSDGETTMPAVTPSGVFYQSRFGNETRYNDDTVTGLGRLDVVIDSAKRHGIKLILSLTGNWNAFGGIDWYNAAFGNTHHDDFYTSPATRTAYKAWVSHLLNHKSSLTSVAIKDDPTIMAFELANEMRCTGSFNKNNSKPYFPASPACGPTMLTEWVKTMSEYFKSIDSNHLLAVGDEGFFRHDQFNAGTDFEAFTRLPHIDFASFHSYFDVWGSPQDPAWLNKTTSWIIAHTNLAHYIGKPVVLGEFGTRDITQRVADMPKINKVIEDAGTNGALFWMLASQFNGRLYPQYDGYTIYAKDPAIKSLVSDHAEIMDEKDQPIN